MIRSIAIFAVLLISSCVYANDQDERYFSTDIRPFLERLRDILKTGDEQHKVPVMDPNDVPKESYQLSLPDLKVDVNLKNVHITGLSDYKVHEGKFELLGLKVKLHLFWNKIDYVSDYDMSGVKDNKLPVYGEGKFNSTIKGLDVTSTLTLGLKHDNVYVASVASTITMESFKVEATGIYKDEERSKEISKRVSAVAPDYIRKYPSQMGAVFSDILESKVNVIIADKTFKELLDFVGI